MKRENDMKNKKIIGLLFLLLGVVFFVTGCEEKDPSKHFKNPVTVSTEENEKVVELTYDDDGTYEVSDFSNDEKGKIIKCEEINSRLSFNLQQESEKRLKTLRKNQEKLKNKKVIDVKYGKLNGFASIDLIQGNTDIYLYTGDEKTTIKIAVSPINVLQSTKEIKGGTEAQDVLYNQKKIQQTLKTIKYTNK